MCSLAELQSTGGTKLVTTDNTESLDFGAFNGSKSLWEAKKSSCAWVRDPMRNGGLDVGLTSDN